MMDAVESACQNPFRVVGTMVKKARVAISREVKNCVPTNIAMIQVLKDIQFLIQI
jgi:hypothetical protein